MKILTLHYTNIGPFEQQSVTIHLHAGSYMIQAPIGSGKSILFFDGPIFALYKKSSRPLLNMHSSKGEVVIEFQEGQRQYCIQRKITRTKTGESIKSTLREKASQDGLAQETTITIGEQQEFIPDSNYTRIEFKNESDLQNIVDEVLPHKDVALATYFLMQDSVNVFELKPQERLLILKSIFDLLGIDESKEKIAQEKRALGAQMKLLSDTSRYETKFQDGLRRLRLMRTEIVPLLEQLGISDQLLDWFEFARDQELLGNSVLIENFSLPALFDLENLDTQLAQQQEQSQVAQTKMMMLAQQQEDALRALRDYQGQYSRLQESMKQLKHNIEQSGNLASFETIRTQIQTLKARQSQLEGDEFRDQYQKVFSFFRWSSESAKEIVVSPSQEFSLARFDHLLQHLLTVGKGLKQRLDALEEKQKLLAQHNQSRQGQVSQAQELVQHTSLLAQEQKDIFDQHIQGKSDKEQQVQDIVSKGQEQSNLVQQYVHALGVTPLVAEDLSSSELLELTNLRLDIQQLREYFSGFDRAALEQATQSRNELETKIRQEERQLDSFQDQMKRLQQYQQELAQTQGKEENLTQQVSQAQEKYDTIVAQYTQGQELYNTMLSSQILEQQRKQLASFGQAYDFLSHLLGEYKDSLLMLKQIKIKEKMLGELYLIFSKELLLLVIQSNLPKIQDLMNAYLAQVVDYSLVLQIDKKSLTSDNLELMVTVQDQYGDRQVEALSGGQKVILKLVWMIAISFVTHSPMLFLDETINNLDADTVSKVAALLSSFVATKGEDFQLYVVSHNQQIQDLALWDRVIELKTNT